MRDIKIYKSRPDWDPPFPPVLPFVDQTIADLRSSFASYDHTPSLAMWGAIKDIVRTIDEMSHGKADPIFYVSSLDPGVGKTQTIVHAVRNLPHDVGVLVCLSRIKEVDSLVGEMDLNDSEFSVIVSSRNEDKLERLGNKNPNDARVLFTTQQMIDEYVKNGRKFQDLADLYFADKPRSVRIWDESLLPGKEITINIHEIGGCQDVAKRESIELANALSDMQTAIKKVEDGAIYQVPDLDAYRKAFQVLRIEHPERRETLEGLQSLSAKAVRVKHDYYGRTVLDYTETLPDDFAPLLILDASARVRKTYALWEQKRGNLRTLGRAGKLYRDLKIHHWNKGGGKWAFEDDDKFKVLIDGIVSALNTKPDEEWLVIVHKSVHRKVSGLLCDLLGDGRMSPKFATWGNHHATNQYRHIRNVVLAGTPFYERSDYVVRARAALGLKADEELDPNDLLEVTQGEHQHLILQALCRGSVRKCIGDSCAPMDAYIIASADGIPPKLFAEIFPRCTINEWQPVEKPLKGKIAGAVTYLRDAWTKDKDCQISFDDMMKHIGITNRSNFNRTIRADERFRQELQTMEAYEIGVTATQKHHTGFERIRGAGELILGGRGPAVLSEVGDTKIKRKEGSKSLL